MLEPNEPLTRLVRQLDEIRPDSSLIDLAAALKSAKLSAADVEGFMQTSHTSEPWERIAVPELQNQAATAAEQVCNLVHQQTR